MSVRKRPENDLGSPISLTPLATLVRGDRCILFPTRLRPAPSGRLGRLKDAMRATPLGQFRKHALLALAFILLPSPAAGDAIVRSNAMQATTIVEFFIDEGRILVELEIGAVDMAAFRNLMPDGIHERMGHAPRPLAERLEEFFARDLPILGPNGTPLPGGVLKIGPGERVLRDRITGEPLPAKQGEQP